MLTPPTILPFRGIAPRIDETAFIAANVSIIGDVEIGAGSSIWYGCTVRGDVNQVRIGRGSNLQDNSTIHVDSKQFPTLIGDDVLIGHQCLIHGCTVGAGATVGMQSCLMDGVVVEPGAMVAAGSLVTPGKIIPRGQIWSGRPAKFFREMDDAAIEGLAEAARYYARLAQEHKAIVEAAVSAAPAPEADQNPEAAPQGPLVGGRPWEGP
ncbi:MAG: gamma carbonic anhydrase family protein [Rhodospirillaceae bacterium]|nr:gamma carbonic anhydrase family protein [Rhodospirillaceae bacterium]